ncbi:MAG: N-acetylmuramoyl-L-alanine amidase [Nannocystis sp.]|nr:N-acetylmuramoyl-L-alanine amidase [Nannocystis sp.]
MDPRFGGCSHRGRSNGDLQPGAFAANRVGTTTEHLDTGGGEAVPSAMMNGLAGLCRALMGSFAIPLAQVTAHRKVDVGLTACPGRHFDLDDLRRRIEAG